MEDWIAGPRVGDYEDAKDYEIAHLKWLLVLTQQTATNRLEEIHRLREELYG